MKSMTSPNSDHTYVWWKSNALGFCQVDEEEMKLLHYPVDKKCWSYFVLMMPCGALLT